MKFLIQLATYYPLVTLSLFFASGIATGYHFPAPFAHSLLITIFSATLLLSAIFLVSRKRFLTQAAIFLLLIPFSFGLGLFHISTATELPKEDYHIYNLIDQKQEAVIAGTMQSMASSNEKNSAATIDSHWIRFPDDNSFSPVQGKIRLTINNQWPQDIKPGDTLLMRAVLKRPHSYKSPGAFDYSRYLAEKKIWIVGFVRSPLFLKKMGNSTPPQYNWKTVKIYAERCRSTLADKLNTLLPQTEASLYRALLLGDRSAISPEILENFKASGVLHLLAISGLHLTVLWGIIYFFCYWLLSRSEFLLLYSSVHILAALFTLPIILMYAFLAGLQTPVLRAVIMSSLLVFALVCRRQTSAASLLATAALLLLLIQPLQLFSPSFQLSFLAVASIFLLLPWLQNFLRITIDKNSDGDHKIPLGKRVLRYTLAGFALSSGISLLTAPITIFHFNRVSYIGPFTNLILEPLLCLWSLPLGFFSLPLLFIEDGIFARLFLFPGATGVKAAAALLAYLAELPFAFRWIATPAPSFLLGTLFFYFGLFFFITTREKFIEKKAYETDRKIIKILSSTLLLLSILFYLHTPAQRSRIIFLDVGQGSATLIEYDDGHLVLIDGGGTSFSSTSVGERVIGPYLFQQGRTEIDQILLTHPDADHYNGLKFLLTNFSPDTLWIRDTEEDLPEVHELVDTAKENGCAIKSPKHGDFLFRKRDNNLVCLYNFGKPSTLHSAAKNRGLVLTAKIGKTDILVPGDIDKEAEMTLLRLEKLKLTTVLLAAHHGSKTSNSKSFLAKVNPEIVVVSAGQREGIFPSHNLIQQLSEKEITMLTTAQYGTIEIEVTPNREPNIYVYTKADANPLRPYRQIKLEL